MSDPPRIRALMDKTGPKVLPVLAALVAVVAFFWQVSTRLLAPYFVGVVQEAVAADTERRIEAKIEAKLGPAVQPLKATLLGMLESKIGELEDQVQLEEYRKSHAPAKWQEIDELRLAQMRRRLSEERKKLEGLK